MAQRRSPTDTVLAALEEFGQDEPVDCMVIFTTSAGDICSMGTTDVISTKLGMLEAVKALVVEELREARGK